MDVQKNHHLARVKNATKSDYAGKMRHECACGSHAGTARFDDGFSVSGLDVAPLGTTYEITKRSRSKNPTEKPLEDPSSVSRFQHPPAAIEADEDSEKWNFPKVGKWGLQRTSAELLSRDTEGKWRVGICHQVIRHDQQAVTLFHQPEGNRVFFGGLMVCGSVWVCPVCAGKISERRREDLVRGFRRWIANEGHVQMLTLTVPHRKGEPLAQVLSKLMKARQHFRNSRTWKREKDVCAVAGTAYALEVTYGDNGWHVHTHEILFLRGVVDRTPDVSALLPAWKKAATAAGLRTPNHHGLSIQDGQAAANYIGKWGLEHELTKAHVKRGKKGGMTPWDMLRDYHETGSESSAALFLEYAKAFKGKRQLVWSRGMRNLLALGAEKTDEQLANERREQAVELMQIRKDEWAAICGNDMRGELLEAAREGGVQGVKDLLSKVMGSGRYRVVKQSDSS